jgi:hypothetical protein
LGTHARQLYPCVFLRFDLNSFVKTGRVLVFKVYLKQAGSREQSRTLRGETPMLWTIAVVLIILWLLGLVSSYTMGGFIHILLVIAIVVVLVRVIQGKKVI